MSNMERFRDNFREEATELLNSLEDCLLQLESNPDSEADIAAVFRAMHTIKGSAAMFGFAHISHFTHDVENVLDQVRSGTLRVSKGLINATLAARDHILELLEFNDRIPENLEARTEELLSMLKVVSSGEGVVAKPLGPHPDSLLRGDVKKSAHDPTSSNLRTFRVRFNPRPDIMKNGTKPLSLLRELMDLGDCTIIPDLTRIPPLDGLTTELSYVHWDVLVTSPKDLNDIREVFMFVEDKADVEVRLVDSPDGSDRAEGPPKVGEILVDRGVVTNEVLQDAISKQSRLGALLVDAGVPGTEVRAALEEQKHIREARKKNQTEAANQSIRVNSQKLDAMVDLVGELVTLQARISQTSREVSDSTLLHLSENLERLTGELRDTTMSMRMLPIGSTFIRFKRLVRDLGSELGKETDLETSGGETELDKTVLEKLQDPLVHLIRNAVDHGIEDPESRKAMGKPALGTVVLSAEHAGSTVLIKVKDDGKGVDAQAIQKKAVEKGLIPPGQLMSEQEAFDLIFLPGFSTAKTLSSVSGRGVGLDVVKKEIESLSGNVHIHSKPGQGTTFTLEIPLTLAIIEGLLVQIAEEHFVIPLALIEECLEFNGKLGSAESSTIRNRGAILPILSLRNALGICTEEEPSLQQIVVVNVQDKKLGMIVDKVIGDHQTVIKNLGRLYRQNIGMSGATILGNGNVALILDVIGLVGYFEGRGRATEGRKGGQS